MSEQEPSLQLLIVQQRDLIQALANQTKSQETLAGAIAELARAMMDDIDAEMPDMTYLDGTPR